MYALLQHYKQPLIQFTLKILMPEQSDSISYNNADEQPIYTSNINLSSTSSRRNEANDEIKHRRVFTTSPGGLKSNKRQRAPNSIDEGTIPIDKQVKKTCIHSAKHHSIQASRFACPYFKHDPIK